MLHGEWRYFMRILFAFLFCGNFFFFALFFYDNAEFSASQDDSNASDALQFSAFSQQILQIAALVHPIDS